MLGPDLRNGSVAQLTHFRNITGVTFPLLLCGSCQPYNLLPSYGDYDNYAVINKQGIIRYHANDLWRHGDRYHLNEILATVDSLVSPTVDVADGPLGRAFLLNALPNPFRGSTSLELTNPTGRAVDARVTVHDLAGRQVGVLFDAPAPGGVTRMSWDGRDEAGPAVAPGVYLVRARMGGVHLVRRVVQLK